MSTGRARVVYLDRVALNVTFHNLVSTRKPHFAAQKLLQLLPTLTFRSCPRNYKNIPFRDDFPISVSGKVCAAGRGTQECLGNI